MHQSESDDHQSAIPRRLSDVASGTILLTVYGDLHHQNEIPRRRLADMYAAAARLAEGFDSDRSNLGAIAILLADVPAEPLISVSTAQKGSVLGIATLAFLLGRSGHATAVKAALDTGDGVIILRVTGDVEDPQVAAIEVFDTWAKYSAFLAPHVKSGVFQQGSASSL